MGSAASKKRRRREAEAQAEVAPPEGQVLEEIASESGAPPAFVTVGLLALTLAGAPLLWPLQKERNFHLLPGALRVRTGGPVEPLITMNFLHFAILMFGVCVGVLVFVSLVTPAMTAAQLHVSCQSCGSKTQIIRRRSSGFI